MNCETFKQWIGDRDPHDEILEKDAGKHVMQCDGCERLYIMDTRIESRIRDALRRIDPPERLVAGIEMNIQAGKEGRFINRLQWKILTPAFVTAILLFIVLNPLGGRFRSFDEIGARAVEDHLSDLPMTLRTSQVRDVPSWFDGRLRYRISPPNLGSEFQIKGVRKCRLGSNDVAYLLYEEEGKRASLFIIDSGDLDFSIKGKGTYYISELGCNVQIWKHRNQVYAMVK